jgi:predicted RNA-binding Zn ribbon-like protein
MMNAMPQNFESPGAGSTPSFLADHPVLDLLNTVAVIEGKPVDFLQTDEDILRWLDQAGIAVDSRPPTAVPELLYPKPRGSSDIFLKKMPPCPMPKRARELWNRSKLPPQALLKASRTLREVVRTLVEKRKAGARADTKAFNAWLAEARSYPQLVWEKTPRIVRERDRKTPEQFLSPLAEAAADLLANGDFDLIRKCEDNTCVLWFYDRTKSHRRRWCSMAMCGNRNKVKAFRQRQQG